MGDQHHCSLRMLATTPIAMILLLTTIYESILTVSGTSSSSDADLDYYYKRMYDFGLGKRAYTYSANKRPQYDFGIGKRSLDSNRQKLYAFGLGKRFTSNTDNIYDYYDDDIPHDDLNKRIKPYEFGLGKRAAPAPYSFGLGKRYNGGNSGQGKLYSFGLGKRGYNNYNKNQMGISQRSQRYNFGIGKRDVNDDLGEFFASLDNENNDKQHNVFTRASQKYNFGLGKRSSYTDLNDLDSDNDFVKRGQRFNFGLGKRNIEDFSDLIPYEDGLNDQHDLYTRASQKFNFGLGKREVSKEELQLLQEDILPTLTSSTDNNSNSVSDQPNHTSNTRKREINYNDENNDKQHQITLTNQMH